MVLLKSFTHFFVWFVICNFLKVGLGTVHAIPICCYDRSELVICTNSLEMHKTRVALYVTAITHSQAAIFSFVMYFM